MINEHFESVFNKVLASAVVVQKSRLVNTSAKFRGSMATLSADCVECFSLLFCCVNNGTDWNLLGSAGFALCF